MDTWETVGEQRALDMAVSIKDFLLRDLHRTAEGETFCFSYTPIDRTAVYNANLLGASLLICLFKVTGEEALREAPGQPGLQHEIPACGRFLVLCRNGNVELD